MATGREGIGKGFAVALGLLLMPSLGSSSFLRSFELRLRLESASLVSRIGETARFDQQHEVVDAWIMDMPKMQIGRPLGGSSVLRSSKTTKAIKIRICPFQRHRQTI